MSRPRGVLPRAFYARDATTVARALLGKTLVRDAPEGRVAGRIVEVEAYRGPEDRAAHTYGGRRTARVEAMWGPPGHAYVYFVYGMHWCLNAVASKVGSPEAALLRAAEPLEGAELMRARRFPKPGARTVPDARLAAGPANLCRAFAVDGSLYGADLRERPLYILDAPEIPDARVRRTPRIGVDYAGAHAARPWRFVVADSPAVSR